MDGYLQPTYFMREENKEERKKQKEEDSFDLIAKVGVKLRSFQRYFNTSSGCSVLPSRLYSQYRDRRRGGGGGGGQ